MLYLCVLHHDDFESMASLHVLQGLNSNLRGTVEYAVHCQDCTQLLKSASVHLGMQQGCDSLCSGFARKRTKRF